MGLSKFFIDRPIFAWVIALGVMMVGIGAIMSLSVAQYPDVAPPSVSISANYPGASAQTLETSVTSVLEQQLTGIDGLLYFSSSSDSSGSARIVVTFVKGTNPDVAQVQVQNKVQQALSRLPTEVQQLGLTVAKSNVDFLLIVALYDKNDKASDSDMADYLVSNFQDEIARVSGVGQSQVFGSQYAIRIWLDPNRLAAVQLMPSDVQNAVLSQNVDVSAGQIGQRPSANTQMLNAVVTAKARLKSAAEFANIVVKTQRDGSVVRLSDVARVELGEEDYTSASTLNAHPASGMALQLAPGADALKTAEAVKQRVADLATHLPDGYAIAFPRDTTDFIKLSVKEVVETLIIAVILVVIVMFLFLQNWRATLIPAIAVPVVLLGTFGVLAAFGYSINTLTLFGMVLAIGLLVDDAIVVVENVERIMATEGLHPREATIKSMGEIGSALIGIALVLSAVLLPMAFFGGSTGVIYRQFSITIVSAMLLSVLVALILTPALCSTLLKPVSHASHRSGPFARFNRWLERSTDRYVQLAHRVIERRSLHLGIYAAICVVLGLLFLRLPTSFLPVEDQGQVMVQYTLPPGATAVRSDAVRDRVSQYFLMHEKDNLRTAFGITGFSFSGSGQNAGMTFTSLAAFDKRKDSKNSAASINKRAGEEFKSIRDAQILVLTPPAVRGLGQSQGLTFELLNTSGLSREDFQDARDALINAASKEPMFKQVRSATLEDTPQLRVVLDEPKLAVLGLAESDVIATLSSAWGSTYINDFIDRGRVKKVFMQADAPFRSLPNDLNGWFVRSSSGQMVPFSSFATLEWHKGPTSVSRFNGHPSFEINAEPDNGASTGEAMARMIELQQKIVPAASYAWSGLSFQENQSSGQAPILYGISILVVFLCLAALYESWSVPLAVLLVIPLGVIGAVLAVSLRGLENNIYFQVGLLTTIGLASKNAILIVEFAEMARRNGKELTDAALQAAHVRLRPIIMTSVAFIAGVLPLAVATGAGAQSRIAIGTAVAGGTLTATLLAIFYVPLFFFIVARVFHGAKQKGLSSGSAEFA
jgi:multidrug efflux pump